MSMLERLFQIQQPEMKAVKAQERELQRVNKILGKSLKRTVNRIKRIAERYDAKTDRIWFNSYHANIEIPHREFINLRFDYCYVGFHHGYNKTNTFKEVRFKKVEETKEFLKLFEDFLMNYYEESYNVDDFLNNLPPTNGYSIKNEEYLPKGCEH